MGAPRGSAARPRAPCRPHPSRGLAWGGRRAARRMAGQSRTAPGDGAGWGGGEERGLRRKTPEPHAGSGRRGAAGSRTVGEHGAGSCPLPPAAEASGARGGARRAAVPAGGEAAAAAARLPAFPQRAAAGPESDRSSASPRRRSGSPGPGGPYSRCSAGRWPAAAGP